MTRILNIVGYIMVFVLTPIIYLVGNNTDFNSFMYTSVFLGVALIHIPLEYKIGIFQVLAWLSLFFSIYLFINSINSSVLMTFLAFIMYGISGGLAGLNFKSDDSASGGGDGGGCD